MNLSLKCCQLLKLVTATPSRNLRICTRTRGLIEQNVASLYEGRNFDRRTSIIVRNETVCGWKHFCSSSISRSSKKSDDKVSDSSEPPPMVPGEEFANLGLIARFKKMYKEYWYVLVPVHLATSAVWFGSFYYASKSGMDIVAIMQSWNFNETLIKPFRDSSLGHVAVAYLLYKIATPARYTVTLGSTTVAIKHLVRLGYIKPVPSRAQLMQIYQDKKEEVQTKVADKKAELIEKKEAMKEEFDTKKQQIFEDYEQFKEEFKDSMKTVGTVSNPQPPPPTPEEKKITEKSAQKKTKNESKEKVSTKA